MEKQEKLKVEKKALEKRQMELEKLQLHEIESGLGRIDKELVEVRGKLALEAIGDAQAQWELAAS